MIILNGNQVPPDQIYAQVGKIQANPDNSRSFLDVTVMPDGNLDVDFQSHSQGSRREIAGAIAGNLSHTLGGGFKLPKKKRKKYHR